MPSPMERGLIVVGVDGSAGSDAAFGWALAEAKLRGARVRAVVVHQPPHVWFEDVSTGAAGMLPAARPVEDIERLQADARAAATRIAEDALARAGQAAHGVDVELAPLEGTPAETLIAAGREADLLVVGSRGRGGFLGLLLGSVSQQLANHPPCPVVILPPPEAGDG